MSKNSRVHTVGDDLFEKLGLADVPELRARVDLAFALAQEIRRRGLTQARAARLLGISQPDVSNLIRGNVAGFSQERIERLLNALDLEVRIQVGPRPKRKEAAEVTVQLVEEFS